MADIHAPAEEKVSRKFRFPSPPAPEKIRGNKRNEKRNRGEKENDKETKGNSKLKMTM